MDGFIEELDNCWEEYVEDYSSNIPSVASNVLTNVENSSNEVPEPLPKQIPANEVPVIQEIRTKKEFNSEENSVYHCSLCDVHLHNVITHINKFHKNQIVLIKRLHDDVNEGNGIKSPSERHPKDFQKYVQGKNYKINEEISSKKQFERKHKALNLNEERNFKSNQANKNCYSRIPATTSFLSDEIEDSTSKKQAQLVEMVEESINNETVDYNEISGEIENSDDNSYNTDFMEVIEVNEEYIKKNLIRTTEENYQNNGIETLVDTETFEDLVIFKPKHQSKSSEIGIEEYSLSNDPNIKFLNLKQDFKCEICFQILKSKSSYQNHIKNYHPAPVQALKFEEKKQLLCSICNTYFPTAKSLGLHQKMHKVPFKTMTLEEATKYSSTEKDKLTEFFYCNLCQKKFHNNLKNTHKKFHEEENNEFLCGKCNRKYPNKIDYTYHMKLHEEESEFEKPTKRLTKAEKLGIKLPYECAYCGRTFARPYEKVKHERIHTGEKPFKCEVCGKCFRVSYSLTLHLRTHTNDRPYACSFCNKRFKSHGVYAHHLLIHSDERHFKCDECPKAFKTAVQLHGHKNSHKKPFNCLECNRKFASMFAVKFHMETHKKLQLSDKYSCNICGAMYAREYALKDHMKEIHGNINYDGFKEMNNAVNFIDDLNPTLDDGVKFDIDEQLFL